MGKRKKKHQIQKAKAAKTQSKSTANLTQIFNKYPQLWGILLIGVLLVILYHKTLINGKPFLGGDQLKATMCYSPFIEEAIDHGIYPLWNPYIFSGMPSFASLSAVPLINLVDTATNYLIKIFTDNDFVRIFLNYLFFGWVMFLLLRRFKLSYGASLFAAVAVVFIPQYVAFGVHAHNTKLLSLVLIPLILYLVDNLLEKRNLLYFALTSLALGFQLFRAHVQVCFYTYLLIGFYFVFYSIVRYKEDKSLTRILQSGALLLGTFILAFCLSSIIYLSVYEYSHFSIRGGGTEGGLSYDYATGWSFSPLEMLTFFVPSFVGFGGNTYWGPMGFTDYPLYMSIIILYLIGVSLLIKRNRLIWFFSFVALFSLIVSFGKHFPLLYYPMFELIPFFNKFRIPSMIHILLDISAVILAAFGLNEIIQLRKERLSPIYEKKMKQLVRYSFIFWGFCVLISLFLLEGQKSYNDLAIDTQLSIIIEQLKTQGYSESQIEQNMDYIRQNVAQNVIQQKQFPKPFKMAQKDSLKMELFFMITFGLIFAYLKKKLTHTSLVTMLIALVVIDLLWVDFKIVNDKLNQNEANSIQPERYFRETEVVKFLKQQQGNEDFRIYSEIDDPNWYLYFLIQNVNGYNAAKLRIYQEMIEKMQFNPKMLSMLNTKYIITNRTELPGCQIVPGFENKPAKVFESNSALPRAFFVNKDTVFVNKNSTPGLDSSNKDRQAKIFQFLKSESFKADEIAILEEPPPFSIEPSDNNHLEITGYDIQKITLKAVVDKPAHLVLSEIYYPAGWKAYVDGRETKIYKTNYVLRSIFLQPGDHEIEFVFKPSSFKIGAIISIITFIVLIAILAYSILRQKRRIKI